MKKIVFSILMLISLNSYAFEARCSSSETELKCGIVTTSVDEFGNQPPFGKFSDGRVFFVTRSYIFKKMWNGEFSNEPSSKIISLTIANCITGQYQFGLYAGTGQGNMLIPFHKTYISAASEALKDTIAQADINSVGGVLIKDVCSKLNPTIENQSSKTEL